MSPTLSESESTPLLEDDPLLDNHGENWEYREPNKTFAQRAIALFQAEGESSWADSYQYFWFGAWLNILLIFVPLSFIAHHLSWNAVLRFMLSFIAIMPLAKLLGEATNQISKKLGPTMSGLLKLLNAWKKIIVGVAALRQGEIRIFQTSMLGSILTNLLLGLGCCFLIGGLKFKENNFQTAAVQTSSSVMTLSCLTLVIPAAYHSSRGNPSSPDDPKNGLLIISRGTTLLLLIVYIAYLFFQLKTHDDLFKVPVDDEEEEESRMNTVSAVSALLIVTVITSFCADYLVASIKETANWYNIPKSFIGLVLLPMMGNTSAQDTAVRMAMKGKMDRTIGICVGNSIQIAAFVAPLLVVIGWISGIEATLFFADFETIVLFASVLLVDILIQKGKSNYMDGLLLVTLYLVIGLAFWAA